MTRNPGYVDVNDPMFDDPDDLVERVNPPETLPSPIETQQEDKRIVEERAMASMLQELGANPEAYISVHRSKGGRANGTYLFKISPSETTLPELYDYIRDEYGAGDYQLLFHNGRQVVPGGNQRVSIGGKPLGKASPTMSNQNDDKFAAFLVAMQERDDKRREEERERREREERERREDERKRREEEDKRRDREETRFMKMMEMMVKQPANNSTVDDLMKVLSSKMIAEMMNPKKDDAFDTLDKVLSVAEKLGGGNGEESTLQTLIKTFAKPVSDIAGVVAMQAASKGAAPALSPRSAPKQLPGNNPAPKPEPAEPVPDANPPTETDTMALIRMIERAAAAERDPETYADMIIDQLGEANTRMIFTDDNALGMILGQMKREIVEARVEWFAELREIVLELLDNHDQENTDNGPGEHEQAISDQTGDANNPESGNTTAS